MFNLMSVTKMHVVDEGGFSFVEMKDGEEFAMEDGRRYLRRDGKVTSID